MSIGYNSPLPTADYQGPWEALGISMMEWEWRQADAAKARAEKEELLAGVRRGDNGGACPFLARQHRGATWLPVPTDSLGRPIGCGLTERQVKANAIAAWAVDHVPAPYYLRDDPGAWFDTIARVAAGETKGMPGGKNSAKGYAVLAIDAYREANPVNPAPVPAVVSATPPDGVAIGSTVTVPSGPFEGFVGIVTGLNQARVTLFGRDHVAAW